MDLRWPETKIAGLAVAGLAHRSQASGPLIGRRDARILARRELGRLNIAERLLLDLRRLFGLGGGAVPSGWFGLIVLGVLAAALVIVIFAWVRPARHRRERKSAVIGNKTRTAQDYRKNAARLAAAGDFSGAIVDGVRGIAAELEERGILPPRLGRTADELALEAAAELPSLTADLRSATRLFDDIRYGDRPGTEAGYQLISRLDAAVRTTPATAGGTQPVETSGFGLPR